MAIDKILKTGIVPIFSHSDTEICLKVVETCYNAGLKAFEFTNRTENSLEVFEWLIAQKKTKMPDLALGIGTVFNKKTAESFLKVGAEFIVSPIFGLDIMKICKQYDIPYIPGVFSPAEIYNAHNKGANLVKIFPGEGISPNYIKALRGPMPTIKIMVTGGVTAEKESIEKWFGAGANCVGMGSKLISSEAIQNSSFDTITNKIEACLQSVKPFLNLSS